MYLYKKIRDFTNDVFLKIGCSVEDAERATEVLISADLSGIDSHGVARLSGYIRLWEAGKINTQPKVKLVHETPSTGVVDGDSGLGLIVAPKAMEIVVQKAKSVGSAWISIKNSTHFGIAGYHAMMALKHDMVGIAMTNASPLVSPTFSIERMLGTNPIAVAVPAGKHPPFVADFATTTVANGKLEILERENKKAPTGWLQDKVGESSNNPNVLKEGGALLPLGSDREHGSHKGFCLGAIVDIFSGVFSGANFGPWVPPFVSFMPQTSDAVGEGVGHFLGAMRIDGFRPADEFKSSMDSWINRFSNAQVKEGMPNVIIPGTPERLLKIERLKNGIPLNKKVVTDLKEVAKKFNLSF